MAAFILPTAHATAAGCVRSTIDAGTRRASVNVYGVPSACVMRYPFGAVSGHAALSPSTNELK